jgi:hypothetical protein
MDTRRVAGAGLCVLVIAALSGATAHAAPGSRAAVRHRAVGYAGPARQRTVRFAANHSSAQFTSRNWDGYIAYENGGPTDFNVVKSTWVEPAVTCSAKNAWTVFWVGLDGWFNGTVEQGGSSARCINSVPHYSLWWEMYPTNAIQTMNAINAGDTVTASVTYEPGTQTFVIQVKDVTTGQGFTENEQCASDLTCDRSSTDVIAEDVGHFSGGYFPLANYGTMTFTQSKTTDVNGTSGGFSRKAWLNAAVTETDGSTTFATVSALSDKGKTFSATWHHK